MRRSNPAKNFTQATAGFLLVLFLAAQPTTAQFDCRPDPEVLEATPPVYPEVAVGPGLQGEVIIRLSVDGNGNVTDTEGLKGDAPVYAAAEKAAREWKFGVLPVRVQNQKNIFGRPE